MNEGRTKKRRQGGLCPSALKRAARVLGAPRTNAKRSTKYNPFQLVPGNPRKSRHRSATNTPCRADRPSPPWARIDAPRQPGVLGVRQRCRVLVPWVDSPTGLSGGCLLCIPDGCAGVLRVGLDAGAAGETRHDGDTLTAPGLWSGTATSRRTARGRAVGLLRATGFQRNGYRFPTQRYPLPNPTLNVGLTQR